MSDPSGDKKKKPVIGTRPGLVIAAAIGAGVSYAADLPRWLPISLLVVAVALGIAMTVRSERKDGPRTPEKPKT